MEKIKVFIIKVLIDLSYFMEVRQKDSAFFRLLRGFVYPINRLLFGMVPYNAMSHREYCQCQNEPCISVRENRVGYSSNVVANDSIEQQRLIPFPMNDILLCRHHKVFVQGGSGLVLDMEHRWAINDYCAVMDDNISYQDTITKTTKQKMLLLQMGRLNRYKRLSSGIMINDRYAGNYYHGLFEILIRLLVVEEANDCIPKDVPIIVDEAIIKIPSLKRVFEILNQNINRPIFVIHKDERLLMDSLFCITPVNSILHLKNNSLGSPENFLFDKEYSLKLKNKLLPYKNKKTFPKKFFITRKNTKHRNYNEDEVYSVLEPMGFQKVVPESLSFEEQMSLFNGAEWIVSGSGAAFTNLLFCSTGCKVGCLYRNRNGFMAPIFTTPAYFNGCVVRYFKSGAIDEKAQLHANFSVDITQFESFIKCLA